MRWIALLVLLLVAGCDTKDHGFSFPSAPDTVVVHDTIYVKPPCHKHAAKPLASLGIDSGVPAFRAYEAARLAR